MFKNSNPLLYLGEESVVVLASLDPQVPSYRNFGSLVADMQTLQALHMFQTTLTQATQWLSQWEGQTTP